MADQDETNVAAFPDRARHLWADGDEAAIARDLSEALGCKVEVSGIPPVTRVTVLANTLDELDRACHVVMTGARTLSIP